VGLALCVGLVLVPLLCLRTAATPSPRARVAAVAAPDRAFAPRASRSHAGERVAVTPERVAEEAVVDATPSTVTTAAPDTTSTTRRPAKRKLATATATRTPTSVLRPATTTTSVRATTTRPTTTTTTAATKAAPKPAPKPAPAPAPTSAHDQSGTASYYSGAGARECAHRTAPIGTIIHVTNRANGKSVDCRVATRGPYSGGRIIDLSEAAFAAIAPVSQGVVEVRITW
jgi:rare lipoprotein A